MKALELFYFARLLVCNDTLAAGRGNAEWGKRSQDFRTEIFTTHFLSSTASVCWKLELHLKNVNTTVRSGLSDLFVENSSKKFSPFYVKLSSSSISVTMFHSLLLKHAHV